jgi:hypothetical protein
MIGNRFSRMLVILIGIYFLAFTGKEKFLEFTGDMHGRSEAKFRSHHQNYIKFVLPKGTSAEILDNTHFPSGNYGLKVKVTSGQYKGEIAWVLYKTKNPTIRLDQHEPRLAERGVATAPTPTTESVPHDPETDSLKAAAPQSETVAFGSCFNCSQANPSANLGQQIALGTLQNPLAGALRTMAAIYQSCDVLKQPPYDPAIDSAMGKSLVRRGRRSSVRALPQRNHSRFVADHYYLKHFDRGVAPQCLDMRKTPPVYHFGGRPAFRNNEIDLFQQRRTGGVPVVGIDCSAFVSTALSVSGLKLTPRTKTAKANMATSRSLYAYNEKNSCFNRPIMTPGKTMSSGDIIAYPGHTFMIDQVGEDPLGIEAAKREGRFPRTAKGCSRMEPKRKNLNFSIIQSSGFGDMPAMRIEASKYSGAFPAIRNLIVKACLGEFNQSYKPKAFGTLLLRHKGNSDSRCTFSEEQTPKLKGEECTQGCTQEII